MERNDEIRADFKETIESYPQYKIYYVDESGIDKCIYREYGYAPIGVGITGKISGKKFKRTNIVAAKCGEKIIAPLMYEGITDSILFECWFEKMLLKAIPKYSIIVLDNASIHRKPMLHKLARNADCEVLFLPPYSPDLNPIEQFWGWLKIRLRKIIDGFDSLDGAIMDCFKLI